MNVTVKRIILAIIALALVSYVLYLFLRPVDATFQHQDDCNETFTYTKTSDFSDSRVAINFENNDDQIDVNAQSGYQVTDVYLEVDGVDVAGYDLHFTTALNNYNPNPGGDIDEARVIVKKVCATPTLSESPTPTIDPCVEHPELVAQLLDVVNPCETETPTPDDEPQAGQSGVMDDRQSPTKISCEGRTVDRVANINVVQTGNAGELEVQWSLVNDADQVHIEYGLTKNAEHALLNTPDDGNEVIKHLKSGEHYWFRVAGVNGCAVGEYSDWFDPIVP